MASSSLTPDQVAKHRISNMGMNAPPRQMVNPDAPSAEPEKSSLVLFLEERCKNRKLYEVPLEGFGWQDVKAIPKIKIRVVTKTEANRAIVGAVAYVERVCAGTQLAKDDPDMLQDAKACWVLFEACRDFDRPDALPAFRSPTWMMDNMTTDQVAVLLNNYNLCQATEGPMLKSISVELTDSLTDACISLAGTELPGVALSAMPREILVEFAIQQALTIAAHRLESADLYERLTEYEHRQTSEEASSDDLPAPAVSPSDGSGDAAGGEHSQAGQDLPEPNV